MTAQQWVTDNLIKHGRAWVEAHYEDHKRECDRPVSTETYSRHIRRAVWTMKRYPDQDAPRVDHEENRPEVMTAPDVSTLDDLKDYARVDPAKYQVTGFTVNTWGSPDNPNKQVKATLKPRDRPPIEAILEDFQRRAAEFAPHYELIERTEMQTGNLVEVSIPDLHFGQLSWAKETRGADYDVKIAEAVNLSAVSHMAENAKSYNPEKILFLLGSDYFNVNNKEATTAHGTPQDEDSRWMKSFSLGCDMAIKSIDLLSAIADVHVIVIRGNHDEERAYYLGEVIAAWYRNNGNVTVDNSPVVRKYFQWGKSLIGMAHGHNERPEQLPLLMATEEPVKWAATEYREFHVGHLHHSNIKSFQQATEQCGVRVMVLPSLAAASAWTASKGFHAIREAEAFVWNKEYGKISSIYYHPGMTREIAAS
jgi:hypothetical protein